LRNGIYIGFALVLLAAACTAGENGLPPAPVVPRGGTLRLAMSGSDVTGSNVFTAGLDFQNEWESESWEIFRCCVLRTLMSFDGRPVDDGGADALPDLSSSSPEISNDGLVWTFSIRSGVHYSPPLQDVEVVAGDFVRALQREADASIVKTGYPSYYSVIQGFDDVREGRASRISGLETPDDHTLVVRLTRPCGELGFRFAMPATAPIPPDPTDPLAPYGIATGHDNSEGRFLVGTGPYMVEGTADLDFTVPPARQTPVAGFIPAKSLTLVRNPSWIATSDPLRAAYVDRMEFSIGPRAIDDHTRERWVKDTEEGKIDLVFSSFPLVSEENVARYRGNPALAPHLHVDTQDWIQFLTMNLAVPPFNDVHVRRAVNLAIDKQALVREEPNQGIATHIGLDSEEGNLLLGYDPYPHDLERAHQEMTLSRYDRNADGRCDALACRAVKAYLPAFRGDIRQDLHAIGIGLDRSRKSDSPWLPSSRVALGVFTWGTDYPNGSQILDQLFNGASIASNLNTINANYDWPMVGASPSQLRGWGYTFTQVPSVDAEIGHCGTLVGNLQVQCWAELDQHLLEKVVPWVPLLTLNTPRIVSDRISSWSFDAFARMPALDRIAITEPTAP
jgi:peptide/nickel transport system substrate-binding protein